MRILNAWTDYQTGVITYYEQQDGDCPVQTRKINGVYACFFRAADIDADTARLLRNSRHVVSMREEGEWLRVDWRGAGARERACEPEEGFFAKKGIKTYDGDLTPIQRWFCDDDRLVIAKPRRCYLDIETCGRVPMDQKERSRILSWCVGDDDGNVWQEVLEADTDSAERDLLAQLWAILAYFDQVIAWNGDGFDFPVVIERTRRAKISVDARRLLWLDQMELFRRMNLNSSESGEDKQSVGLDAVARAHLGVGKLDGIGPREIFKSWSAGGAARKKLLEYNRRDVELQIGIEKKVGHVSLLQTLCEVGSTFPDTRGIRPMPQVEGIVFRLAKQRGVHFETRVRRFGANEEDEEGAFRGAFVMEPRIRGLGENVHVADFSSMYPSIILSWNMSPETHIARPAPVEYPTYLRHLKQPPVEKPEGVCTAATGEWFKREPQGIIPFVVGEMLRLRKHWSKEMERHPVGTEEWLAAWRKSTAYKTAANSVFGVQGAPTSRLYKVEVAEGISQTGAWLIKKVIEAAEGPDWGLTVIYGDTDSIFVIGCSVERFAEFVKWCNEVLFPRLLREQECPSNHVALAYEKAHEVIVFTSAKRYAARYIHYKGKPANEQSKPEIKGLEYKRGDVLRLARRLQALVLDQILGGGVEIPYGLGEETSRRDRVPECCKDPEVLKEIVLAMRTRFLQGEITLEDVVVTKKIAKDLGEYKVRHKKDGTEGAAPPHVRIAKILAERGEDVGPGTRVAYVVTDGTTKPATIIPAADWTGECDRLEIWEENIYPPTERLLAAAFPDVDWRPLGRVRPPKPRGKAPPLPSPAVGAATGLQEPASGDQLGLFSFRS